MRSDGHWRSARSERRVVACAIYVVAGEPTMILRQCLAIAVVVGLLVATNANAAAPCLSDKADRELAIGRLSIGRAMNAADRLERPYILTLAAPVCLATDEPDDKVDATEPIQIFAADPKIAASISKLVGKLIAVRCRPFPAHTTHHHAPIVIDVKEISTR